MFPSITEECVFLYSDINRMYPANIFKIIWNILKSLKKLKL